MMLTTALTLLTALVPLTTAMRSPNELAAMQHQARANHATRLQARTASSPAQLSSSKATISFKNPKAKAYHVDGKKIPEVDFDVGDSWSYLFISLIVILQGLMPISGAKNETRKLFFWFWPSKDVKHTDDLVFWTNGGPGCSSLEGLSQENGPFRWPPGTAKPIPNQWSWTNLSHVLWVEQPVGTGFSQGVPNITNEDELAAQLAGFLTQFLEVFSELKGKNFYLSGESYAGLYVPYIANYLYEHPKAVDLKLKGTWITDPSVSWDLVTEYIPALPFAKQYQSVLRLNESFLEELQNKSDACGFTDYSAKYATYPPKGPLPLPSQAFEGTPDYRGIKEECAIWDDVYNAAITINPNFNVYRIVDVWPVLWDILGFPGSFYNIQSPIYFNRTDVQKAIHAPQIEWGECSNIDVFVDGVDTSLPPFLSVMPNVIEKSERTVVMHGGFDYVLIAEGTRIAIQNMTWSGKQGFQTPIEPESFVIDGFGVLGTIHQERITYVEVDLAGHMMPQFAPWAAYKTLWYLLGRGEMNSTALDLSLYPDDYQLYGDAATAQSHKQVTLPKPKRTVRR